MWLELDHIPHLGLWGTPMAPSRDSLGGIRYVHASRVGAVTMQMYRLFRDFNKCFEINASVFMEIDALVDMDIEKINFGY